jgi:outer membrane protein with beta-barrel domain
MYAMRYAVSAVLTALMVVGVVARTDAQPLTAGARIGIDFSSLPNAGQVIDQVVNQTSTETSSKVGILVGGFITVPVWGSISFQPELNFVTKGVKLTEAAGAGTVTATLRYLEFPLLARYALPIEQDDWKGYVLLGPTFAVKAGTSAQFDGPSQTRDVDIDPAIRTFDGGLAFAGGLEYDKYFVEVRYTLGLSDVGADSYPHNDSLKTRTFAISGGIRFK